MDCIKMVVTMNPCPCGYYPSARCRCTDYEIIHYRGKISGPIMERIDIQKNVRRVNYFDLSEEQGSLSSDILREKVEKARAIQQERFANDPQVNCNAQMTTSMIQKYCKLDEESTAILKEASEKHGYSAWVIHKLLRLARTAADLRGAETISREDIIFVLAYGIDQCYPIEHKALMRKIENEGLLISEYPPETVPYRHSFPRRNRIIAGLSDVLYVIDAGKNSGTKTTVEAAERYGKQIVKVNFS